MNFPSTPRAMIFRKNARHFTQHEDCENLAADSAERNPAKRNEVSSDGRMCLLHLITTKPVVTAIMHVEEVFRSTGTRKGFA